MFIVCFIFEINMADSLSDISDGEGTQSDGDLFVSTESESDDGDIVITPPTWSPFTAGMKRFNFTKESKLLWPIPGEKPIDWFRMILDDSILEFICSKTNKYALELYCSNNTVEKSRITKWKDLTVPELLTFLGLLLHTGSIKLNRIQDYWLTHRLFNLPSFREHMSRDRFLGILRCLYFSTVRPQPGTADPQPSTSTQQPQPARSATEKIDEMVYFFNNKMALIYYPNRELSIDESMVLWRGRLHFRQYIKGKRHKFGVKLYSLNEPDGLTFNFKIYSGGKDDTAGVGHTEKVVLYLMNRLLNNGHSLFMDNYYNSFTLASKLLSMNTYCTGTLRRNRKCNPKEVENAKLTTGETVGKYAEGVLIGKWHDKRDVLYISTEFENEMATINNRFGQELVKPLPIIHYNANMKGTDRQDQMMSYYPLERKTLRWYKKIFVHIIHMCLTNSYMLYNMNRVENGLKKVTLFKFRLEVIEELLPPKTPAISPRQKRPAQHELVKNDETCKKGFTKRKNCRVCYKEGKKNKQSIYICSGCPGKPALCAIGCFEKFHNY